MYNFFFLQAISYLITGDINSKIEARLSPGYDDVRKSKNGNPKLRYSTDYLN